MRLSQLIYRNVCFCDVSWSQVTSRWLAWPIMAALQVSYLRDVSWLSLQISSLRDVSRFPLQFSNLRDGSRQRYKSVACVTYRDCRYKSVTSNSLLLEALCSMLGENNGDSDWKVKQNTKQSDLCNNGWFPCINATFGNLGQYVNSVFIHFL